MPKLDPRPYPFVFVGTVSFTVAAIFNGLSVLSIEGGVITRAATALQVTDTLATGDVLTITPTVLKGTTTLDCQRLSQEFSGNYADLDNKPAPTGGGSGGTVVGGYHTPATLDGLIYSALLFGANTPIVKKTATIALTLGLPEGTLAERVIVAVADDADPSTYTVTLSPIGVPLEYAGTQPLLDNGNPVVNGKMAIFVPPRASVENGNLPARVKLQGYGNPVTLTITGAGLLSYADAANAGATKISAVDTGTGSSVTIRPFAGVQAGSGEQISGSLNPEKMPVVAAAGDLTPAAAAVLDNATDPPRWVYKRADGVTWYGPAFTSTP